jgi:hypothetical protein
MSTRSFASAFADAHVVVVCFVAAPHAVRQRTAQPMIATLRITTPA